MIALFARIDRKKYNLWILFLKFINYEFWCWTA